MARYAQGYERKNSDTKNLIILFSIIVGVVVLSIVGIFLINSIIDHSERNYESEKYADYYIELKNDDINSLCLAELENGNPDTEYCLYVCEKDSTSDTNMVKVLDYLDKYIEAKKENSEEGMVRLYLFDSDDLPDDVNLNGDIDVSSGMLLHIVNNNQLKDGSYPLNLNQVVSSSNGTKAVREKIDYISKNNKW